MKEVSYNLTDVIGRLSARIANLETDLAHESAAKDAFAKRVKELENEKLQKENDNDKPNDNETE